MSDNVPEPIGYATVRTLSRKIRTGVGTRAAGGRWKMFLQRGFLLLLAIGVTLHVIGLFIAQPTSVLVDAAVDARLAGDERDWPVDDARDVAVRAAVDVLTFGPGETSGPVRAASRTVEQTVTAVTPGQVEVLDDVRATVRVSAQVETVTTPAGSDAALEVERTWRHLAVPVRDNGTTVLAVGAPVEVAPPAPGDGEPPALANVDSRFTADTEGLAEAIFAAWAGDSRAALDAVTDGSVPLLAADVELVEVSSWQVTVPGPRSTNRTTTGLVGAADVTWLYDGEVTATYRYRVDLERNEADRWQATGIGPLHHPIETDE